MTSQKDLPAVRHGKTLVNFKKTASLISKIIKMIEADDYCVSIMQQNLAAIGLLKSAQQMLLEGHLQNCFRSVMESKNEKKKQEMIREILQLNKLCNK